MVLLFHVTSQAAAEALLADGPGDHITGDPTGRLRAGAGSPDWSDDAERAHHAWIEQGKWPRAVAAGGPGRWAWA